MDDAAVFRDDLHDEVDVVVNRSGSNLTPKNWEPLLLSNLQGKEEMILAH